jgi:hypothetical protein
MQDGSLRKKARGRIKNEFPLETRRDSLLEIVRGLL